MSRKQDIPMPLPQLAIFDMDGLIFDTERLFMNKKALVLKEYGYEHREEDYLRTLGTSGDNLRHILHEIYGADYPADEISAKTRHLVTDEIERSGLDVKFGIQTLLQWFRRKNIPCCVASSTAHATVENYLNRAGLGDSFSFVIGGDEVTHSKPNPDLFLAACVHYHIAPHHALVLEDSENGILAASNAGIPVVCIPDLKMPDAKIAGKATAIVSTALDVIGLF